MATLNGGAKLIITSIITLAIFGIGATAFLLMNISGARASGERANIRVNSIEMRLERIERNQDIMITILEKK